MAAISFDPARKLTLYFRVARDGSKTFSFVDANGTAKDVSGYSFAFSFKYRSSDSTNVISIANGDLTRPSNDKVTIPVDATLTNVAAQEYYWQMDVTLPDTKVHTWLTGEAKFHNGEFDGVTESSTITVDESGTAVTIAISESGTSLIKSGTLTENVTIDKDGNDFNISGDGDINIGSDYLNNSFYTSGGYIYQASDFAARLQYRTPSTGSGTWDLIHGITDGVSDDGFELSQNGAIRFRVPRVDGGWDINMGSDATGDLYYRNSSGKFTRLPAGTEGQVLTMRSGIPTWE